MPNQDFFIPDLPTSSFNYNPQYGGDAPIFESLRSIQDLPKLSTTLVPQVERILGEQGQFLVPQIQAIREQAGQMTAAAQSDATARGLTGSDIEAASMLGARQAGLSEEGRVRGDFAMRSSQTLIDTLTRAMMGDLESAQNLRVMLSEAMGQSRQGYLDRLMFGEQLAANERAAARSARMSLWGGGLGALGAVGAGALISDSTLKEGVSRVAKAGDLDVVKFKWTKDAEKIGLRGEAVGLLAQQVKKVYPKAVGKKAGYLAVDYSKLPEEVTRLVYDNGGPYNRQRRK